MSQAFRIFLFFVLFYQSNLYSQKKIELSVKNKQTENQIIDDIINKTYPYYSLEKPKNQKEQRRLMRKWNPHIKDWRGISQFDHINVKRKRGELTLSIGHKIQDTNEDSFGNSRYKTENKMEYLRSDWILSILQGIDFFGHIEVGKQKKIYVPAQNKTYDLKWK